MWVAVLGGLLIGSAPLSADIVVLANRTKQAVACQIALVNQPAQPLEIAAGDLAVLSVRGQCDLTYGQGAAAQEMRLAANAVYTFVPDPQSGVTLHQIDLGETEATADGRSLSDKQQSLEVFDLPVKILVDNYELTRRDVWEPRLRARIANVSRILERSCLLRLKIVSLDQWVVRQPEPTFPQALQEFRNTVDPHPARLAIGFTGRYSAAPGPLHLGGTQGMLQSHILVREWSANMSEVEREEVLLHEIGHYLGAVHSPDPQSVMRPILADNQAVQARFRVRFDPVNTLLVNLVSEEIRIRSVTSVTEMTDGTRTRLDQIYGKVALATPQDSSARQYQLQLGATGDESLAAATRKVVDAVRTAAVERARQPDLSPAGPSLAQDRLTEHYVRRAAAAAQNLPADTAPVAFLLGLGMALDDSPTLLQIPLTRGFSQAIESPAERAIRCRNLDNPTVGGRRDLAQHFFLSGYLTAVAGATAAEAAGLSKELADAEPGGSGFSFHDLAADLAGIHFASRVLAREWTLENLASTFEVQAVMPGLEDLPQGLPWDDVAPSPQNQERVAGYRREILDRLDRLRLRPPAAQREE
jgi:hypothetical protein